jgi:hypothetical protein
LNDHVFTWNIDQLFAGNQRSSQIRIRGSDRRTAVCSGSAQFS